MLYYGSVAEGLTYLTVSEETWADGTGGRYGATPERGGEPDDDTT
jgi:hypothetical protein